MSRRRPHGWSSLLLASLLALLASPASARQLDDPEADTDVAAAEQKAAQAFEAYQAKSYAESVTLYLEAYQAAPSANVLYNVARIYDTKLGDRPLAINFYRRYISDPGAAADRIQVANERLVALREAELAATPAQPEPSAALAAGASADASATDAVGTDSDAASRARTAQVTGIVMGVTGLVAIGVGTGYGIAAMRETETVNDTCPNNVCSSVDGIEAADDASDHAAVSTIAFVTGGVLLAAGAVFYFWLGDEPSDSPERASSPGLKVALDQRPGGLALQLGGAW